MAKRKKNFTESIPKFAGKGQFMAISFEMINGQAFRHLKGHAAKLYLYMRTHYKGKRTVGEVARKYPSVKELQRNDIFFFTANDALRAGMYGGKTTNKTAFYRDVRALQDHGFIKCVARGGRGRMAIYQFIDAWQSWKP